MTAHRAAIALSIVALAACDDLLGLHDITPDREPVGLTITAPARGVAQQPLGAVTVNAVDIRGAVALSFNGEIELALGNNPGGARLMGTLTATATAGTARFDLVGIDQPGAGYTLVASASPFLTGKSSAMNVIAPRFKRVSTGVAGGPVSDLVVSPPPPGGAATLFAATGDATYRSVDGGATWNPASFGAEPATLLAAAPGSPGVVYLRTAQGALKKTVDGGATWHAVTTLPSSTYVASIAIDPRNPSVVYTGGFKPMRSTNGGATWTELSFQADCSQLVLDPVAADTLYCSAYVSETGMSRLRAYRASGGSTWTTVGALDVSGIGPFIATPTGVIAAAGDHVYRSTDAGKSWHSVLTGYASAIAYAPSMPGRVYVAQGNLVQVSSDGGESFASGIPSPDPIARLVVDPTNPDRVYASSYNRGVQVSSNAGASWSPAANGLDVHQIGSVAIAPGAPDTVLIATEVEVLRSSNGGASWAQVSQSTGVLSFDPIVSTRAYLCGFSYFATSDDRGASFAGNFAGDLGSCNQLQVAGTTFLAAASQRLLKSIDGGVRWTDLGIDASVGVNDVAFGDAAGTVVVAAATTGILRSTDGGKSFIQVVSGYQSSIAADPKIAGRLVAGTCTGFLVSSNAGATFGTSTAPACVQRVWRGGAALYAVTLGYNGSASTNELATSTDGGATWKSIDVSGLPPGATISALAASGDGTTIYLGTQGGLYRGPGT